MKNAYVSGNGAHEDFVIINLVQREMGVCILVSVLQEIRCSRQSVPICNPQTTIQADRRGNGITFHLYLVRDGGNHVKQLWRFTS